MRCCYQLTLASFDYQTGSRCKGNPRANGYKENCIFCPYAVRGSGRIFCSLYSRTIRAGQKYSLGQWKDMRKVILKRDNNRCIICGSSASLHVHHIGCDATDDSPTNLVTLCNYCHARAHGLQGGKNGGQMFREFLRHSKTTSEIPPEKVK